MQKQQDPEMLRKCQEMTAAGYMTWEQAKECAKIAVDYSATINGIRQERVDYLKENIDRL